jgi:hypothetical protein
VQGTRVIGGVVAALVALGAGASSAGAATTIGQTGAPYAGSCATGQSVIQGTLGGGAPYSVPAGGGVITSWQHVGYSSPGGSGRMQVWKPPAAGSVHTLVARTDAVDFTAGQLVSYPARIPVSGGEVLGIQNVSGAGCGIATGGGGYSIRRYSGPEPAVGGPADFNAETFNAKVNVSASLETDADKDGFGDETQDKCLGTSGTDNGCPAAGAATKCAKKKKKKKKGKKKSVSAAKKKKKKKKGCGKKKKKKKKK